MVRSVAAKVLESRVVADVVRTLALRVAEGIMLVQLVAFVVVGVRGGPVAVSATGLRHGWCGSGWEGVAGFGDGGVCCWTVGCGIGFVLPSALGLRDLRSESVFFRSSGGVGDCCSGDRRVLLLIIPSTCTQRFDAFVAGHLAI